MPNVFPVVLGVCGSLHNYPRKPGCIERGDRQNVPRFAPCSSYSPKSLRRVIAWLASRSSGLPRSSVERRGPHCLMLRDDGQSKRLHKCIHILPRGSVERNARRGSHCLIRQSKWLRECAPILVHTHDTHRSQHERFRHGNL